MRTLVAAVMTLALAASALAEERLVLKSGREVIGTIVSRDEREVTVRTGSGALTFATDQIARVEPVRERQPAPAPVQPPARPKVEMSAEALAALRSRVMFAFGNANTSEALRAAGELVASWPASEPVLDEALRSPIVAIRLDAVYLLATPELGDTTARVLVAMADGDATIRVAAIRIVRRRQMLGFRAALALIVEKDDSWAPRHEALRTLEDVGTVACLRTVLDGFAAEHDETRRFAYRRVLTKLTGANCGDDLEAWRAAVESAVTKTDRAKQKK